MSETVFDILPYAKISDTDSYMLGRNWTRQNCASFDSPHISCSIIYKYFIARKLTYLVIRSRICREAPPLLSSVYSLIIDATNSLSAIFFFLTFQRFIYGYPSLAARWLPRIRLRFRTAIKLRRVLWFPMFSLFFPRSLDACCSLVANPFYHSPSKLPHVAESMTSFIFKYDIEVTYAVQLLVKTVMREYHGNYLTRRKVLLDYSLSRKNQRIATCTF